MARLPQDLVTYPSEIPVLLTAISLNFFVQSDISIQQGLKLYPDNEFSADPLLALNYLSG